MSTEANRMQRGSYLIKGGAVITVDPALGTMPKADVLVRDGVDRLGWADALGP